MPVGSFCLSDAPILVFMDGYGKFLVNVNGKCLLSVENYFSGKIEQNFSKIPVDMLGLMFCVAGAIVTRMGGDARDR